jgi:hypothetical protein
VLDLRTGDLGQRPRELACGGAQQHLHHGVDGDRLDD